MSWRCSSSNNQGLVENLKNAKIIRHEAVFQAMMAIDRGHFVGSSPYHDSPQPIGFNATISAPHMHAYALEYLESCLKPRMKVLDVGSGSGIFCAYLAQMVGSEGRVIGIDHIEQLVEMSKKNIKKTGIDLKQLDIVLGDGRQGFAEEAPFDAIHVGASCPDTPHALIDQLKEGGRLVAPVGTMDQVLMAYDKDSDGKITTKRLMGVQYIPLTSKSAQIGRFR